MTWNIASRPADNENGSRSRAFEWAVFLAFAVLLALVSAHHEMEGDAFQAWLIARDTHSLSQLLHVLRYEGHPTLWYLLLWIPTRISWNPVGMQIVNYLIALGVAWLVLSMRRLARPLRILVVFSNLVFYQYGVIARSYELATLLLLGAAVCLIANKRRPVFAVLLLMLAINTHALAVPIAAVLALWGFVFLRARNIGEVAAFLRRKDTWAAFLALALAAAFSYYSARPALDLLPVETRAPTLLGNFIAASSMSWQIFLPYLPSHLRMQLPWLLVPSVPLALITFPLCMTAAFLLGTFRARAFFLTASLLEFLTIGLVLGLPYNYHLGFFLVIFVMALLMETQGEPGWLCRLRLRESTAFMLICAVFGVQALTSAIRSYTDWIRPYALANEAAAWLRANHLERNPLVFETSEFEDGVVSILQLPSAYFAYCKCQASYELRRRGQDMSRRVTLDDLRAARGGSPLPVLVITNRRLAASAIRDMHIQEIHESYRRTLQSDHVFFMYRETSF